jgi:hypothetical protein
MYSTHETEGDEVCQVFLIIKCKIIFMCWYIVSPVAKVGMYVTRRIWHVSLRPKNRVCSGDKIYLVQRPFEPFRRNVSGGSWVQGITSVFLMSCRVLRKSVRCVSLT